MNNQNEPRYDFNHVQEYEKILADIKSRDRSLHKDEHLQHLQAQVEYTRRARDYAKEQNERDRLKYGTAAPLYSGYDFAIELALRDLHEYNLRIKEGSDTFKGGGNE